MELKETHADLIDLNKALNETNNQEDIKSVYKIALDPSFKGVMDEIETKPLDSPC